MYGSSPAAERKGPGGKTSSAGNMLRSGENIFLDDVSVEELEKELETEIVIVDEDGADLVASILDPPEHNKQIRRQMYEQASSCDRGEA